MVFVLYQTGLSRDAEQSLLQLPPEIGKTFLPLIYLGPWLMLLIVASAPLLVVDRPRRERVEKVEQDLPLSLELLATLSEAGLGFDAALARLLASLEEDRPLAREFRTYQADLLAGRTRVESLRRLARRLEVSSVSILVSALVQAEQLGSGIAQPSAARPTTSATGARAGKRLRYGLARQTHVSPGSLLHAGHFHLDAGAVLRAAFRDRRQSHAGAEDVVAGGWRLLSRTTGKTIVERLTIAAGFWSRFIGWQFRAKPAADEGLLMRRAIPSILVSCVFQWIWCSWTGRELSWLFVVTYGPGG